MLNANSSRSKWSMVVLTLAMIAAFSVPMLGQEAPVVIGDKVVGGIPDDWSHHHVVISNPGKEEDAIRHDRYDRWLRITNDPRYALQQLKRKAPLQGPGAEDAAFRSSEILRNLTPRVPVFNGPSFHLTKNSKINKDWTMSLAAAGSGTVGAGNFPAKFTFSTSPGNASCSDFVVYNTSLVGSATQPTIIAYNNIYPTCNGGVSPTVFWQYNTSFTAALAGDASTITTSVVLTGPVSVTTPVVAFIQQVPASGAASLVLLKYASSGTLVQMNVAARNVAPTAFSTCATPCMTRISFSGGNRDLNSAPFYDYTNDALYVGDSATTTTDPEMHKFIHIFTNSNTAATAPQECTTTTQPGCSTTSAFPRTTGHGGGANMTSVVQDPSTGNVYFGQDVDGRVGWVNSTTGVLTISAGTGTAGLDFQDGPLVDSSTGTTEIYFVGETGVWQFPGAFLATNNGVNRTVGAGSATGTYYSGSFDNIYYDTAGAHGHMYVCGTSSATGIGTPSLYAINFPFSAASTVTAVGTIASAAASCSPVTEFAGSKANTSLTAALGITGSPVVASTTGIAIGDYLQIDSELMLVTATSPLTVTRAQLGTAAAAHGNFGQVQDIQDWIYASVTARAVTAGSCTGGATAACIYAFNATSTTPAAPTAGANETGGTSGIIIDNSSTVTGESQIYFSTLGAATCTGNGSTGTGTHGCAVQASQSNPNDQ